MAWPLRHSKRVFDARAMVRWVGRWDQPPEAHRTEMNSRSAMALLVNPSAPSAATSLSRVLSAGPCKRTLGLPVGAPSAIAMASSFDSLSGERFAERRLPNSRTSVTGLRTAAPSTSSTRSYSRPASTPSRSASQHGDRRPRRPHARGEVEGRTEDPTPEAEVEWGKHVQEVRGSHTAAADELMVHRRVPGKPCVPMVNLGGAPANRKICADVVGFRGPKK